ncbi:hypothetical protein LSAT2_022623, partial [Lamellibrachia satsuma]
MKLSLSSLIDRRWMGRRQINKPRQRGRLFACLFTFHVHLFDSSSRRNSPCFPADSTTLSISVIAFNVLTYSVAKLLAWSCQPLLLRKNKRERIVLQFVDNNDVSSTQF